MHSDTKNQTSVPRKSEATKLGKYQLVLSANVKCIYHMTQYILSHSPPVNKNKSTSCHKLKSVAQYVVVMQGLLRQITFLGNIFQRIV